MASASDYPLVHEQLESSRRRGGRTASSSQNPDEQMNNAQYLAPYQCRMTLVKIYFIL
ncbi:MAG: hypothetical protein ACLTDS_14795 [Bianqueaceae bacterium]